MPSNLKKFKIVKKTISIHYSAGPVILFSAKNKIENFPRKIDKNKPIFVQNKSLVTVRVRTILRELCGCGPHSRSVRVRLFPSLAYI